MSIVIIGGNERMVCQYEDICRSYGYKAKVFAKKNGMLKKNLGSPDLMVLFTNTVSHKMVLSALNEAKRGNIPVERIHSSSAAALSNLLEARKVSA
ncbi:MAG: DUF2325 domain-containing protein [Clostridia bacterium]|nr:DUF2325 domain-containing protein [Clostridia bacterium]MBQ3463526.1 DUF2325 domain-containing protein [Clostridia bacterium]MBQ6531233.1 DUF2325 domain-containing protein [Clostridia bacterium]MBQ9600278.1 DUF2325 domain-containing protein [Clostridia bacterium]MBR0027734.1 DUF2325 domain-containing protein [Clostridia bacterium]